MDTCRQRGEFMVKVIMPIACLIFSFCVAEPMTNVTALIGVPLTTNEIARLPSRDAMLPDTVFLGVVKAMQTGNLRELCYHFDGDYLVSLPWSLNATNISEEIAASFHEMMVEPDFSNIVVTAYSASPSNQYMRVSASLQENFSARSLTDQLLMTLLHYDNGWKIVSYDDDKWDE